MVGVGVAGAVLARVQVGGRGIGDGRHRGRGCCADIVHGDVENTYDHDNSSDQDVEPLPGEGEETHADVEETTSEEGEHKAHVINDGLGDHKLKGKSQESQDDNKDPEDARVPRAEANKEEDTAQDDEDGNDQVQEAEEGCASHCC